MAFRKISDNVKRAAIRLYEHKCVVWNAKTLNIS
jgi:hypothetical protein